MALENTFHNQLGKNFNTHRFTIYMSKQMDGSMYSYYNELVEKAIKQGYEFFEFDFFETEYISSSGLGCLVNLYKKITVSNVKISLINLNDDVKAAFHHSNLDSLFTMEQVELVDLDQIKGELNEAILKEFNLLATLSKTASRILEVENEDDIPSIILNTLSYHLKSPLALYFKSRGASGYKWSLETVAGYSFQELETVECHCSEHDILHCHLEDQKNPFMAPDKNIVQEFPDHLQEILSGKELFFVPVYCLGKTSAFMLFVVEKWENMELGNIIHIISNYAGICSLAIENRRLNHQYENKTNQLNQTIGKLEHAQNSLVEAGKLANLGVVISSLAHHLNNRLVPILGYSQLVKAKHGNLDANLLQKVSKIEESAIEVQRVLNSLIGVARQQNLSYSLCNLDEVVESTLGIYNYEIKDRNIKITKNYDERMPKVKLDRELVEQALITLLQHILGSTCDQTQPILKVTTKLDRDMAIIEISSNGNPFSKDEQNILLDPFGTMRNIEDIKLLNLLVVSEVIKAHRGLIEVINEQNHITVTLVIAKILEEEN